MTGNASDVTHVRCQPGFQRGAGQEPAPEEKGGGRFGRVAGRALRVRARSQGSITPDVRVIGVGKKFVGFEEPAERGEQLCALQRLGERRLRRSAVARAVSNFEAERDPISSAMATPP